MLGNPAYTSLFLGLGLILLGGASAVIGLIYDQGEEAHFLVSRYGEGEGEGVGAPFAMGHFLGPEVYLSIWGFFAFVQGVVLAAYGCFSSTPIMYENGVKKEGWIMFWAYIVALVIIGTHFVWPGILITFLLFLGADQEHRTTFGFSVASVVFALATIPIGLSVFMDDGKMWKPVTGYRSAGAVPQYMGGYSNIQGQSPKALAAQIARAQYAQ